MLDADLANRWAAALRSGKYQQGKRFLRLGEQFCCLGVLCDVIDPTGWNKHGRHPSGDGSAYVNIEILDAKFQSDLAGMNDDGASFAEIARFIDAAALKGPTT
jgi:hypothetical protein